MGIGIKLRGKLKSEFLSQRSEHACVKNSRDLECQNLHQEFLITANSCSVQKVGAMPPSPPPPPPLSNKWGGGGLNALYPLVVPHDLDIQILVVLSSPINFSNDSGFLVTLCVGAVCC